MSNVVSLEGVKKEKASSNKTSDTHLIEQCVIYAQSVAAFEAGFTADPDGHSFYAENIGGHGDRAVKALKKIATCHATTAEGLQAKARIVSLVMKDSGGSLNEPDIEFFLSFGADVKTFLQPLVDQNWRSRPAPVVPIGTDGA